MANLKASLYWHCKTATGWRFFPIVKAAQASTYTKGAVIIAKNGRIPAGAVTIDGVVHDYPQGSFQLRTYDGRRSVFRKIDGDSAKAFEALELETQKLRVKKDVKGTGLKIVDPDEKKTLAELRRSFMHTKLLTISKNTATSYKVALKNFLSICTKTFPSEIEKNDMLAFPKWMLKHGYADSTIFIHYSRLVSFLEYAGVDKKIMPKGRERPQSDDEDPIPYTAKEINVLFAAIDDELYALAYEFYLKTGLRRRELSHLEWANFDFDRPSPCVHVRNKRHLNYRTKSRKSRTIPLEPELCKKMLAWQTKHPDWQFVFGKDDGTAINDQFMYQLKMTAQKAGLNCGRCDSCLSRNLCEHWIIHKFRHTYATALVRNNVNVRTLQTWLGHASLVTTMKYLAKLHDDTAAVEKMPSAFAGFSTTSNVIEMPRKAG